MLANIIEPQECYNKPHGLKVKLQWNKKSEKTNGKI